MTKLKACSVVGCQGSLTIKKGLCSKHYQRFKKNGTTSLIEISLEERLKRKILINKKSGCWEWLGERNKKRGYGRIFLDKKRKLAHRMAAHVWKNFDLTSKLLVLHHCDNNLCINPEHLFIGTQDDNMRDMANKKRGRVGARKLSTDDYNKINKCRNSGEDYDSISEKFNISERHCWAICHGRTMSVSDKNVPV